MCRCAALGSPVAALTSTHHSKKRLKSGRFSTGRGRQQGGARRAPALVNLPLWASLIAVRITRHGPENPIDDF